jgi:hypothetical protein
MYHRNTKCATKIMRLSDCNAPNQGFFVPPAWCFWHRKAELQRSSATDLGAIGLVA